MNTPQRLFLALNLCLPLLVFPQRAAPRTETVASPETESTPTSGATGGLIRLDVVVTDQSGKPVTGLDSRDFTLLDNGEPSRIISFQPFDGSSAKPDPPVGVILLIDTLGVTFKIATHEREEVERFLRQDGGHLPRPVSIFGLSSAGLWKVDEPSRDGNVLAAEVAQDRETGLVMGAGGSLGPMRPGSIASQEHPALAALRALRSIASTERRKPGRKLLIWIGPSWELGSEANYGIPQGEQLLDAVSWFSTSLRDARIALYSFQVGETNPRALFFHGLTERLSPAYAEDFTSLDIKALAVESGGRVLAPTSDTPGEITLLTPGLKATDTTVVLTGLVVSADLVKQINSCIQEASPFYLLSFDPAPTNRSNDYHRLEVKVGNPNLTAHTNAGYFDQPGYSNRPTLAAKSVTVDQLGEILEAARGKRSEDLARELSGLELTERLSDATLAALQATVRGSKAQAALSALADASAFLAPPARVNPSEPTPDAAEQQRIIALATSYLSLTMRKLPNFFATQTTIRYEETPQHYDQAGRRKIDFQPLHVADSWKATVLYRNGSEVVSARTPNRRSAGPEEIGLTTKGAFGPILGAVTDAIATPGGLAWSRWEQNENGPRAVFSYEIPQEKSRFKVGYCCLPDGDGNSAFQKLTGYHGEIAIDPASGAILRLALEADLSSDLPLTRADTLVEYGPVELGGKTYICPAKSISISRSRTVMIQTDEDESYRTFGPYAIYLNDAVFADYHLFRSESRILTGFDPLPEPK
jgi:VWFA-related protein